MLLPFEALFRTQLPSRDKLLARLFGIIGEDVVRLWAACDAAPYRDLGRPTIRRRGAKDWSTLDFTFATKDGSLVYVAEMKCELEYQNYRYMKLTDPAQLDHHNKPAFKMLLTAAAEPDQVTATIRSGSVAVHGAILVWGEASQAGCDSVKARYGFKDVLTVSSMIRDLNTWQPNEWTSFVADRKRWANELFEGLLTLADA